ncbi:S8 family serine peptidase [Methanospirillum lacunae]|uniref:Uncharacterized protein n=1 Tax=Methanospirillum lacunae TaxID=668570 RepID=A0A2V2MUK3_9EURY|nr:S8 family serine peptidase [Methanospirillum lacunae]PWR69855.1 hypothetical protein DK846_16900 [Methanospirillum lacunae]
MNYLLTSHFTGLFLLLTIIAAAVALPVTGSEMPDTPKQQISHHSSFGPDPGYAPHQILVRFNTPENPNGMQAIVTSDQITAIHASIGATIIKSYSSAFLPGLQLVRIPDTMTVSEAISWYKTQPSVRYAEPDLIAVLEDPPATVHPSLFKNDRSSSVPNDPYYQYQWSLNNTGQEGGTPGADIKAEGAWNITTGSRDVVVAVLDGGVDYLHPDLIDNIWTDPVTGEHGYDFVDNDSDPMDDEYHGTACAGLIAATGNNSLAMTGVGWKARIMALKWIGSSGWGFESDAISSIEYAMNHGADIISNSWNLVYKSDALIDAVNRYPGLMVWSAANDNMNTDDMQTYAHFQCRNVVSVMASDNRDEKASFSNFGRSSVYLDAPGKDILLIVPMNYTPSSEKSPISGVQSGRSSRVLQSLSDNSSGAGEIPYIILSGTSFAAPLVAGTAALIKAAHPEYNTAQIKSTLIQSVDSIPSLSGFCISGGRLNASAALSRTIPAYDAIENINLPSKVHPGSTCPITVTVQNAGTVPWTSANSVCLKAENSDAIRFNTNTYQLPGLQTVNPGESVVFAFNGTAPGDGSFQLKYRMYQNASGFGQVITGYTSVTNAQILPEIPRALMDSAMVSNNGSLFLIGGYDVYSSDYSDLVYRYDIRNMTWSNLTPMPLKLGEISGGVINGKIYIPGGRTTGIDPIDPTTYVYDINTGQWSSLGTNNTPQAAYGYNTAVLGDRLYVLGGTVRWNVTDRMYYLNTSTATWHQAPSMHVPRAGFAVSSGNNTILVAGGFGNTGTKASSYSSAERFDGVNWSWIADIPGTNGWYYAASASEPDGSLWIAGGYRNISTDIVMDHVGTYNLSLNQWRVTPDKAPIWYPRKTVIGAMDENGYFYTAQGGDYESYSNAFERLRVYFPDLKQVSNLHTTKILPYLITWNWTVPDTNNIDQVQVALDGVNMISLPPEIASYTAARLKPDTTYQLSVRTIDAGGNAGQWMNNSAKTAHWYR